jgi:hypothetical protein
MWKKWSVREAGLPGRQSPIRISMDGRLRRVDSVEGAPT